MVQEIIDKQLTIIAEKKYASTTEHLQILFLFLRQLWKTIKGNCTLSLIIIGTSAQKVKLRGTPESKERKKYAKKSKSRRGWWL